MTDHASQFGASEAAWWWWSTALGLLEDLLPYVANPAIPIDPSSVLKSCGKVPSKITASGTAVGIPKWTLHRTTQEERQASEWWGA